MKGINNVGLKCKQWEKGEWDPEVVVYVIIRPTTLIPTPSHFEDPRSGVFQFKGEDRGGEIECAPPPVFESIV